MKTITTLIILLMTACGGGVSNDAMLSRDYEIAPAAKMTEADYSVATPAPEGQIGQLPGQKVIKTGGISYPVQNTRDEYTRLKALLNRYDAYIASEHESKGYDRVNYNVSIKVPPHNFDSLIEAIVTDRRIENKWVNSEDVTSRYYDLQSRIENKKKLEERYQQILKQANKVSDILEVEHNLSEVRTEIESLQGQFKLLSHQIDHSTIDLSFYEVIPYQLNQEPRPGFGTRLLNALSGGWQGFLSFLVYIVELWPFGSIVLGLVWLVRKIRRRRKPE